MFNSQSTLEGIVKQIIGLLNTLTPLLITLALVLFLWGGIRFIYKAGDAREHRLDKEVLIWGLVALFVAVSIGGILRFLCTSFFSSSTCQNQVTSDWGGSNSLPPAL